MNGSLIQAVTQRIAKSQHAWKQIHYKLLRKKAIAPRIKRTLWNSLIRSTMIYGLHTTEMPPSQTKRMEAFMYKNIRTMMNPGWKEEKRYPEKLYEKLRHPTIETWMGKTQVMTMLTQTRDKKTIHPKHCNEMKKPRRKLQEQWKKKTRSTTKQTGT